MGMGTTDGSNGTTTSAVPKIPPDEMTKVTELRGIVRADLTPYYDTDFNLLRWLKGHSFRLDEVVPKLRGHLAFRRSPLQLDTIVDAPRNHAVHSYWRAGITCEAGPNTPNTLVNIEQSGANDYWGLLRSYPLNEIMKARIYDLEMMLRAVMEMEARSGHQSSILYIMDLSGLKYDKQLVQLMTGALASISNFMSEHYVELIHSFVLVNAPSFISMIWSIASPLLPERTRQKVKILGASSWRRDILTLAGPEALPSYWNLEEYGAAPGDAALFKASVERAAAVDRSLYYGGAPIESAQTLSVAAGKAAFIGIRAEKQQLLEWVFETDGHFGYAIYFCESEHEEDHAKMRLVYPKFNKVPGPTFVPIADQIRCPESGYYRVWFSNQHAWLHTLHVRYRLTAG